MPTKVKFPTTSSFFVALCIYIIIVIMLFIKLTFFTEPAKRYTDDKDAFIDILVPEKREESKEMKAPEQKQEVKKEEQKPKEEEKQEQKKETTNKPVVPDEPLPTPTLPKQEEPKPEPKKEEPKPEVKPEPKPAPQIVEDAPEIKKEEPKPTPKPDLKNLFNDIDTSKLKATEKPKEQKTQSRQKNEQANQKPNNAASDIIKSLKLDKTAGTPKEQKTGTYNPLLGAITKQIERRWRTYKANTNSVAEIRVTIDARGNFEYEITKLPYDDEFNDKVKECLEKLRNEKFPFSPNGDTITLNLKLEDKLETQ